MPGCAQNESCCGDQNCARMIVDKAAAMSRVDHDEELYREIVELFLEDSPIQIQKLRDALDSGDLVVVNRQAHSLKSASANIGAEALRHVAFELEKTSKQQTGAVLKELCDNIDVEFRKVQQYFQDLKPR